jgi:hypothetical protein
MSSIVDRIGTTVVLVLTTITLLMLCSVGVARIAALDLHVHVGVLQGQVPANQRTTPGALVSAPFSGDLEADDARALDVRAAELDQKSDRLTEALAVVGLLGILVALITARPSGTEAPASDTATPLASTTSNGTV